MAQLVITLLEVSVHNFASWTCPLRNGHLGTIALEVRHCPLGVMPVFDEVVVFWVQRWRWTTCCLVHSAACNLSKSPSCDPFATGMLKPLADSVTVDMTIVYPYLGSCSDCLQPGSPQSCQQRFLHTTLRDNPYF